MTSRTHGPRGLTLLEIMVALGASAIVLAGSIAAVHSQQRASQTGQRVRDAQGSARNALLFLEQKLAAAGFGMDPALALDFGWYTGGPCPLPSGLCPRDSRTDTDELVFYSRNPNYWIPDPTLNPGETYRGRVWDVVGFDASADQLTVVGRVGDVFPRGQIYQAVCRGGGQYAYVTLAATTGKPGSPPIQPLDVAGNVTLTLVPVNARNPFLRHDVARASSGCFSSSDPNNRARLFQIDRYRFHVRPIAAGGGRYDPYLVLDQGIDADRDDDVDPGDEQILAEGVETLQVSYAFADVIEDAVDATLAPVGATPGTDVTLVAGRIAAGSSDSANTTAGRITRTDFAGPDPTAIPILEVYSRSSFFPYTYGPPLPAERKTNHQGNVRSVRIAVVARSSTPDRDMGGKPPLTGAATFTVLNLDAIPLWISGGATQGFDGFERIRFDTTVSLPNMTNRRMLDQ